MFVSIVLGLLQAALWKRGAGASGCPTAPESLNPKPSESFGLSSGSGIFSGSGLDSRSLEGFAGSGSREASASGFIPRSDLGVFV